MNLFTEQKQTHRLREQTYGYQGGRVGGSDREFGIDVYTLLYLVAQWLRIHLPMQRTWVRSLVRGDPTCRGANKPVCHNY